MFVTILQAALEGLLNVKYKEMSERVTNANHRVPLIYGTHQYSAWSSSIPFFNASTKKLHPLYFGIYERIDIFNKHAMYT